MSYFDGREIAERLDVAITEVIVGALGWRALPPPPSLAADEPPPPAWPSPLPPRYPVLSIDAEVAMALYRIAVRLGLHATGTEAGLLAYIDRLEKELLGSVGEELTERSLVAAHVLAFANRVA